MIERKSHPLRATVWAAASSQDPAVYSVSLPLAPWEDPDPAPVEAEAPKGPTPEEREARALSIYSPDKTIPDMAREIDETPGYLDRLLNRHGLSAASAYGKHENDPKIRDLIERGAGYLETGRIVGMSAEAVKRRCVRMGIRSKRARSAA